MTVGLHIDLPNGGPCRLSAPAPAPSATDPAATGGATDNAVPVPSIVASTSPAWTAPVHAAAMGCSCAPGRAIRVACCVTNPDATTALVRGTGNATAM